MCGKKHASMAFIICGINPFPIKRLVQFERHASFSVPAAFLIRSDQHFLFDQTGVYYSIRASFYFQSLQLFLFDQTGVSYSIRPAFLILSEQLFISSLNGF
jgi:hypothetical protein